MKMLRVLWGLAVAACIIAVSSCKDEILEIVPVATVDVQGPGGRIAAGQSVQYIALPRDDRGNTLKNRPVSWSSSNTSVATVDGSGMVRGVLGGSAVITASVEGKTGTTTADVDNATPRVDQVDPAAVPLGAVNAELRVLGANFVNGAAVSWNGSNRPTVYVSSTELRVTLTSSDAAAAGTRQLLVVNPPPGAALTSAPRSVNVEYPRPAITSLSPDGAAVQGGTVTLTVTGTGFFPATRIHFRGVERTTALTGPTTLQATIPASDIATPGYAAVMVVNPAPGGGDSDPMDFAVRIDPTGFSVIAAALSPASMDSTASTCAVRPNGEGYCWGINSDGQLGDGTNTTQLTPVKIATPAGIRLVTVTARVYHACGLDEVGRAWCWGNNAGGRLGNGSTINSNVPVQVAGGRSFISISAGFTHTCGIEYGGAAWCWGQNDSGQLGDGSGQGSTVPVRVASGQSFRSVAAGDLHACGLSTSGAVHCWGGNDFGQLGDGTQTNRATPVQISTTRTFASLTAGGKHNCATTSGGTLFCWGRGHSGQLGHGTFDHSFVPVQITGISSVANVRGGNHHTCAVTTGGGSWCWGLNTSGQVGSGSKSPGNVLVPTAVIGLPGTTRQTSAGEDHSCSLLTSGQIWCWGQNNSGQLGDNTTTSRLSPVAVAGGITFGATRPGN